MSPSLNDDQRSQDGHLHVGVFGATGQVGGVMRTLLAERDFPVGSIRYFASARSAGTVLPWKDTQVTVEEIAHATQHLLDHLVTHAPPKDREVEAAKARARAAQRYAAMGA